MSMKMIKLNHKKLGVKMVREDQVKELRPLGWEYLGEGNPNVFRYHKRYGVELFTPQEAKLLGSDWKDTFAGMGFKKAPEYVRGQGYKMLKAVGRLKELDQPKTAEDSTPPPKEVTPEQRAAADVLVQSEAGMSMSSFLVAIGESKDDKNARREYTPAFEQIIADYGDAVQKRVHSYFYVGG